MLHKHSANEKVVQAVLPGAIVDNAAFTGVAIDTKGFSQCSIHCNFGAMDIAMAALKLTECETSGGSYTDVTGAIFGTSTDIAGAASALPSATADNGIFTFDVDLRGRKRFLKLAATGGDGTAGTYMNAIAILRHPNTSLDTATLRGSANVLRV